MCHLKCIDQKKIDDRHIQQKTAINFQTKMKSKMIKLPKSIIGEYIKHLLTENFSLHYIKALSITKKSPNLSTLL